MFTHQLYNLPSLKRVDGSIRTYITPEGNQYPSVTTVLSAMSDKTALNDWKERVGVKEARRISNMSSSRGSTMHDMLERLVLNQDVHIEKEFPLPVSLYTQIKPFLEKNVGVVYGVETQLYSDKLKIAGSCDLLAEYNGKKSVIDYKTSIRNKRLDWITDYFLQTAIYAWMAYERTGYEAKQLVVVIAVEQFDYPILYHEHDNKHHLLLQKISLIDP